jgi:hypothetical protein
MLLSVKLCNCWTEFVIVETQQCNRTNFCETNSGSVSPTVMKQGVYNNIHKQLPASRAKWILFNVETLYQ